MPALPALIDDVVAEIHTDLRTLWGRYINLLRAQPAGEPSPDAKEIIAAVMREFRISPETIRQHGQIVAEANDPNNARNGVMREGNAYLFDDKVVSPYFPGALDHWTQQLAELDRAWKVAEDARARASHLKGNIAAHDQVVGEHRREPDAPAAQRARERIVQLKQELAAEQQKAAERPRIEREISAARAMRDIAKLHSGQQ